MNRERRSILLIAPCCDATDVGEAWSSHQWVSGLARFHRVTLLTYTKRNRPMAAPQLPGVEVVEWRDWPLVGRFDRLNSGAKPGYIGFHIKARRWIKEALASGRRFDVVHQVSPLAIRYPCPAVGLGIPLVVGPLAGSLPSPPSFRDELRGAAWYTHLRAIDGWRIRHDPFLRRTYESAHVVIGVAPYVRELLRGISIRRFEFMSETGVLSLSAPQDALPSERGKLHLFFAGRIVRAKGVRDAIRAMGQLGDCPEATFDVVGDGEDLAQCKAEATSLGVSDRVRFHGWLPRAQVDSFYRQADVLLFPSLREPSGNAVLEAMSHGLALIVADNGGPAYAVNEQCGIRVKPETPMQYARDLAAAVRRLAQDASLLARMKAAARTRAADFLWPRKIEWMCDLYDDVRGSH